jgi:hypothetical protein
MLRDLLTLILTYKKWLLVLNTPEYVVSENIKLKIGYHRPPSTRSFPDLGKIILKVILDQIKIIANKTEIAFSPYPRESKTFVYIQNRQVKS